MKRKLPAWAERHLSLLLLVAALLLAALIGWLYADWSRVERRGPPRPPFFLPGGAWPPPDAASGPGRGPPRAALLRPPGLLLDAEEDARWCKEIERERAAESAAARKASGAGPDPSSLGPAALAERQAQEMTREAWAQALRERGNERSIAAADFLLSVLSVDDSGNAQAVAEASTARARLVQAANASRDGFVRALALQSCGAYGGEAACQNIDPRQWAELEPRNAQPWLQVAVQAQRQRDGQVLAEALYQIGQSSYSESHLGTLSRMLQALPQAEQAGLSLAAQTDQLGGLSQAWSVTSPTAWQQWCVSAVHDANRAQICAQVAERLWSGASTLLDAVLALRLGQGLPAQLNSPWGGRAESLAALQQWQQRSAEAMSAQRQTPCGGLLAWRSQLQQRMVQGELNQLRQSLRAAGRSETELAREWRAAQARRAAASEPPPR